MTEVVSAVLIHEGRILLTQRRADKDFPFMWECPGGKVDGNESHHEALRRELREELGVEVSRIPDGRLPVWSGKFDGPVSRPDRASIFLLMYRVYLIADLEPTPREGQGIGWFTAKEMRALSLAPGNQRALESILNLADLRDGEVK